MTDAPYPRTPNTGSRKRWLITLTLVVVGLAVTAQIVISHAGPILKGRVIETLSARFGGRVELDSLSVYGLRGLEVSGHGLRIYQPDDVQAAGATYPLFSVQNFDFHAGLLGLFVKPMHVDAVHLQGLTVRIPPRQQRAQLPPKAPGRKHLKIKIHVANFICDDSQIILVNSNPDKEPKTFSLRHISLHDVGANSPWPYDATLVNAIPRGNIHAVGNFGPWNTETPGDSAVNGSYVFDHVDLGTIKGIAGNLTSQGSFDGQLDKISAHGTANVPNFSLDTAHRPMPLRTRFTVEVDGTTGDTYLRPVDAVLGSSSFRCTGSIVNIRGKGHQTDLDVHVPQGQLQDFLRLAVKTTPPIMTAVIQTQTHVHIRPGKENVIHKLDLKGNFRLTHIHFSHAATQQKIDQLSMRAQGRPREAKADADVVSSQMTGTFTLRDAALNLQKIDYIIPGATVSLHGIYSLDGKTFNMDGKVRTAATLSQMIGSWWKSMLASLADPYFRKNGAGFEVPIHLSGTESAPKLGVDLFGRGPKSTGSHSPPPPRKH